MTIVDGKIVDNSFRPNFFGVEIDGFGCMEKNETEMLCRVTTTPENKLLLEALSGNEAEAS